MKKTKFTGKLILCIIALTSTLFISCSQDQITENDSENNSNNITTSSDQAKIGKDLPNPFDLNNMQKAYENIVNHPFLTNYHSGIKAHKAQNRDYKIQPSHRYYRFLPKDSLQYETLANDTILLVSDVPLGKEVLDAGTHYKDPSLPEDFKYTYYYSVVPEGYENFPNHIEHEELSKMYFAPEDEGSIEELVDGEIAVPHETSYTSNNFSEADSSGDIYYLLELEALKLQGLLDEEELDILRFKVPNNQEDTFTYEQAKALGFEMKDLIIDYEYLAKQELEAEIAAGNNESSLTNLGWFRKLWRKIRPQPWRPHGRITVEDHDGIKVPLRYAEVRVRKWGWLVLKRTRTNWNGYFKTSILWATRTVKYSTWFYKPHSHRVYAGTLWWRARHLGHSNHNRRGWYQHFRSGKSHFYALVHNAAIEYNYYWTWKYGIQKPHYLRINAEWDDCDRSNYRPRSIGFRGLIADIEINRLRSNCEYPGADGIFAVTTHEITHAAHYQLDNRMFDIIPNLLGGCSRKYLIESWATGVETVVTNERYQNYLGLGTNYIATRKKFNTTTYSAWGDLNQAETIGQMNEYTPIVSDLIDNFNQNTEPNFNRVQPVDRVNGYTLKQIQEALKGSRTIDSWERRLRDLYDNDTEGNLTELFDYVRDVRNTNGCD